MNTRSAELDSIWQANTDLKTNIANIFKHNFSNSIWTYSGGFFNFSAESVRRNILEILEKSSLEDFYEHMYWSDLIRQLPRKHHIPHQPQPADDIDELVIYVLRRMVDSIPDLAKLDIEIENKWNSVINQCNHESVKLAPSK